MRTALNIATAFKELAGRNTVLAIREWPARGPGHSSRITT